MKIKPWIIHLTLICCAIFISFFVGTLIGWRRKTSYPQSTILKPKTIRHQKLKIRTGDLVKVRNLTQRELDKFASDGIPDKVMKVFEFHEKYKKQNPDTLCLGHHHVSGPNNALNLVSIWPQNRNKTLPAIRIANAVITNKTKELKVSFEAISQRFPDKVVTVEANSGIEIAYISLKHKNEKTGKFKKISKTRFTDELSYELQITIEEMNGIDRFG